jgi:hypothetical protein
VHRHLEALNKALVHIHLLSVVTLNELHQLVLQHLLVQ